LKASVLFEFSTVPPYRQVMVCKLAVLASLLSASTALRQRESSDSSAEAQRGKGIVDYLFTFGCPKTSAPAMTNLARGDGCFPGYRVVNIRDEWISDDVDVVPSLMVTLAYTHAKTATLLFDDKGSSNLRECGKTPLSFQTPSALLHLGEKYIERASGYSDNRLVAATQVGMTTSYMDDVNEVKTAARSAGWRLVGTSKNGEDVSHLFQHPSTLACQVTFEGSDSWEDWVTDAAIIRVSYCGLSQGIHTGFRNEVRRMTEHSSWQSGVRPKLSSCATVWSVGHSLGGAQATLFAACANNGKSGDKDYEKISWTAGTAKLLAEI
jgi:hypothetical protein